MLDDRVHKKDDKVHFMNEKEEEKHSDLLKSFKQLSSSAHTFS